MKNIFFLIFSGSLLFLPIDIFGEERNLMKLDMSGNCAGCNLEKVYLRGKNLSEANLTGANLSGADLSRGNLSKANLFYANLSGANLENTILKKIIITGTVFCNTKLPWGIDNSGC